MLCMGVYTEEDRRIVAARKAKKTRHGSAYAQAVVPACSMHASSDARRRKAPITTRRSAPLSQKRPYCWACTGVTVHHPLATHPATHRLLQQLGVASLIIIHFVCETPSPCPRKQEACKTSFRTFEMPNPRYAGRILRSLNSSRCAQLHCDFEFSGCKKYGFGSACDR